VEPILLFFPANEVQPKRFKTVCTAAEQASMPGADVAIFSFAKVAKFSQIYLFFYLLGSRNENGQRIVATGTPQSWFPSSGLGTREYELRRHMRSQAGAWERAE